MTEFLHDVVRKQNLDNFMRANADTDSDWENYVDPWGNVGLTQLTVDWLIAAAEQHRTTDTIEHNVHYSGGDELYRVTDSGILGEGPF